MCILAEMVTSWQYWTSQSVAARLSCSYSPAIYRETLRHERVQDVLNSEHATYADRSLYRVRSIIVVSQYTPPVIHLLSSRSEQGDDWAQVDAESVSSDPNFGASAIIRVCASFIGKSKS
jgi:hypothetical protein